MSGERRVGRWIVEGRVQGVGFRFFTRRAARDLEVDGWVRNREDGTVEVAAAGSAERIDRLLEALGRGPAGSAVSGVREVPIAGPGDWQGFDIVY